MYFGSLWEPLEWRRAKLRWGANTDSQTSLCVRTKLFRRLGGSHMRDCRYRVRTRWRLNSEMNLNLWLTGQNTTFLTRDLSKRKFESYPRSANPIMKLLLTIQNLSVRVNDRVQDMLKHMQRGRSTDLIKHLQLKLRELNRELPQFDTKGSIRKETMWKQIDANRSKPCLILNCSLNFKPWCCLKIKCKNCTMTWD